MGSENTVSSGRECGTWSCSAPCHQLGLGRILHRRRSRERDLALAAIVAPRARPRLQARYRPPALARHGRLQPRHAAPARNRLRQRNVRRARLAARPPALDRNQPANRHLHDATLILYDVTSSYVEGRLCPLAPFGYNCDGKMGKQQIVFGLLCAADGCPLAVEVFAGNTADPATVARQVKRIQKRFGIARIALVGDRGMLTTARIRKDLKPAGLDWISALRSERLAQARNGPRTGRLRAPRRGPLVAESLLPDAVAEVTSPDFPGERANRYRVRKHFLIEVSEDEFAFERNPASIEAETRLDGLYAIRTSLPEILA